MSTRVTGDMAKTLIILSLVGIAGAFINVLGIILMGWN